MKMARVSRGAATHRDVESIAPTGAGVLLDHNPWAHAPGYCLSPLRGW